MNQKFEMYIQKYSGDLSRLCMSLCGNKTDAEDLFQDTWLKAIRHYKKYNPENPFDKWLFAICVNTYKNILNSASRRKAYTFQTEEEQIRFFNAIPEITEENKNDYYQLHKAILSLPKKQKIVIVLYYFKDYSIKEIAEITNIPEGTVKSRLSTAKKFIKRRLLNNVQ